MTGLSVGAQAVPACTHENRASELTLEHLTEQGVTERLELVLVDRGVTAAAARTLGRHDDLEVRRGGWDNKQPVFRPIRHAWRVEVARTERNAAMRVPGAGPLDAAKRSTRMQGDVWRGSEDSGGGN